MVLDNVHVDDFVTGFVARCMNHTPAAANAIQWLVEGADVRISEREYGVFLKYALHDLRDQTLAAWLLHQIPWCESWDPVVTNGVRSRVHHILCDVQRFLYQATGTHTNALAWLQMPLRWVHAQTSGSVDSAGTQFPEPESLLLLAARNGSWDVIVHNTTTCHDVSLPHPGPLSPSKQACGSVLWRRHFYFSPGCPM